MEQADEEPYIPKSTNYMSLPRDEKVQASYYAYKVSKETQALASEQGRSIFAEAFFDDKLQVLSNLCVNVLAKNFGVAKLPAIIRENPLAMRLVFDALSVDLPLEKIYCIMDIPFWKRIVLQQIKNSSLRFKQDVNWKNKGISDKFVKVIESKSAEYYPEQEIFELAQKIKSFVTDIHIEHLQSLKEKTFEKYFEEKDSDATSSEGDISDDYDWNYLMISDKEEDDDEENFSNLTPVFGYENPSYETLEPVESLKETLSVEDRQKSTSFLLERVGSSTLLGIQAIDNEIKQHIKYNRALISAVRGKKEEDHRLRSECTASKKIAEEKMAEEEKRSLKIKKSQATRAKLKQKLNRKLENETETVPSLFEMKRPNNEEKILKGFETIEDGRNPELLLERRKKYKYPAKHCHHIDLSFLQWFTNLETLTIEFQGPQIIKEYHTRHYNVSYQDMKNLANGIKSLPTLKIFRLRNSRLDTRKFYTIVNVLKNSKTIEVVDFANDFLDEQCALPIYIYLKHVKCLKSLELEGNKFGTEFLKKLAYGLYQYKTGQLEYLGLARNKIYHAGFHVLINVLNKTNHVKSINLTATWIDDNTISCCVAKSLIFRHEQIEAINLLAVPIEYETSANLESALRANHKILDLNIRGCGMPVEIEYEIEVLLQRNRYLKDNPHIGNMNLTEKETTDILKNKRNPIYERVLAKFNKHLECLENRQSEFVSENVMRQKGEIAELASVFSDENSEMSSNLDTFRSHSRKFHKPFFYDPNTYSEEEIWRQLKVPEPGE